MPEMVYDLLQESEVFLVSIHHEHTSPPNNLQLVGRRLYDRRQRFTERQLDHISGPLLWDAVDRHLPPMLPDYSIGEAEAECASALPDGHEWVEKPSVMAFCNPKFIHLKGDLDDAIAPLRLNREAPSAAIAGNGPAGIESNVGEGLQQLVGIRHDQGEAAIKSPLDDDVAEISLMDQSLKHLLTESIQMRLHLLGWLFPGKVDEVLDDLMTAKRHFADLLQLRLHAVLGRRDFR